MSSSVPSSTTTSGGIKTGGVVSSGGSGGGAGGGGGGGGSGSGVSSDKGASAASVVSSSTAGGGGGGGGGGGTSVVGGGGEDVSKGAGGTAAGGVGGTGGGVNHAWEAFNSQQTWENAVQEDEEGNIVVAGGDSIVDAIRRRRKRLEQNDYSQKNRRVVRDMIRYVIVIIDGSRWMRDKDPVLPPGTRLDVTIEMLQQFVQEFYDQNPLSHLGFILCKNGEAEIISPLSSSAKAHRVVLQSISKMAASEAGPAGSAGGEFSLQNGLEVAGRSLGHQPNHGSREIVIIYGALSTCDPGYVFTETLPRLQATHIRVSTLALAAEMHVCRKLAEETSGAMGVVLDKPHFRDWLLGQCVPPPALLQEGRGGGNSNSSSSYTKHCNMVHMGFPTRTLSDVPTLVHASQNTVLLTRTAYTCPQCKAKVSELPTDCTVCGLKLVLSPHLARSFHHLFPVAPFHEVTIQPSSVSLSLLLSSSSSTSSSSAAAAALQLQQVQQQSSRSSSPKSVLSNCSSVTTVVASNTNASNSRGGVGGGGGVGKKNKYNHPSNNVVKSSSSMTSTQKQQQQRKQYEQLIHNLDSSLITSPTMETTIDVACCYACQRPAATSAFFPSDTTTTTTTTTKTKTTVTGTTTTTTTTDGASNDCCPSAIMSQCPECKNLFCIDCDAYMHETLHNCPGCLCR